MPPVPETLEMALDPVWLSEALSEFHPGTVVETVEVRSLLHGVGTKALVSLTYSESSTEPVPTELCLKAGFEPHNKHILESGTYLKEARFYKDVAKDLPIIVPACYYAGYDEVSKQGVLILEDLRESGVQFGSAQRGNTVEEAAKFLDSLARLHARYWDGQVTSAYPWLVGEKVLAGGSSTSSIYTERLRANFEDGRAATLPEAMRDDERLLAAVDRVASLKLDRTCLVHGDPHAGNLYITSAGEPGFYDWQTMHPSTWAIDVPYYISAALTHEDRRRSVEDLLRHYLERLAAHGANPPSWDEAWQTYRRFLVYGFYMWAITRPIVQPVEVINIFVDRLGSAMVEAETYEALGL